MCLAVEGRHYAAALYGNSDNPLREIWVWDGIVSGRDFGRVSFIVASLSKLRRYVHKTTSGGMSPFLFRKLNVVVEMCARNSLC